MTPDTPSTCSPCRRFVGGYVRPWLAVADAALTGRRGPVPA